MNRDYQKIDTLFKRDEKNIIIPSEFTYSEFEYLKDLEWECTEKIDGQNIHIDLEYCDSTPKLSYFGKTEAANIPSDLVKKLKERLPLDRILECFKDSIENTLEIPPISIYGEGYGRGIRKGGNYLSKDVDFILFDIKIGDWWLKRDSLEDIAKKLGINIVPLVGYMTIQEAIDLVQKGFYSTISEKKDFLAEGLVLKPLHGLKFRNDKRIITKIKTCDFIMYKRSIENK